MLSRKVAAVTVFGLLCLAAYGLYVTDTDSGATGSTSSATAPGTSLALNDSALATALRLVRLPLTADELPFARDALRLANQQMNLAFASAIRREAANPQPMSQEALDAQDRLQRAQQRAATDSALVTRLTAANVWASGADKLIADSLSVAQARIQIDEDRVSDAREELLDLGGDRQGRMQTMIAEHEATSRSIDSIQVRATTSVSANGLVQVAGAFSKLRLKDLQLQRAASAEESTAALLAAQRRTSSRGTGAGPSLRSGRQNGRNDTTAGAGSLLRSGRQNERNDATVRPGGGRAEGHRRLAAVYGGWLGVVKGQERALANDALRGLIMILVIVLVWLFSDITIARVLAARRLERRSLERLRVVARVSLQLLGVLLILVIIFGTPNNLGTIIGLAGAGLTVALKDFIVSFVGWLVLMGRDGVRVGDLVEINGVTGEVVELGLFNTVLHETGNWTDAGHPTGRRVTFTNSYAVEGHYFNFSTSGQWLWDEVRIQIPAGKNPYAIAESLQARVQEVTAESARLAELEWKGAARSPARGTITAAPAITIKPIMNGVEVTLRYITHAAERYEVRSKLYGAAVELLGEEHTVPMTAAREAAAASS